MIALQNSHVVPGSCECPGTQRVPFAYSAVGLGIEL